MTILIIDDNLEVRLSIAYFLEDQGFEVLEADSPTSAKQLLSVRAVSLILLDMNFSRDTTSGEEGMSFLRWLNKQSTAPAVICLTGWGSVALAVQALQLGASDFIEKPWQNDALLASIQQQLKVSQRQKVRIDRAAKHPQPQINTSQSYVWQCPEIRNLEAQLARIAKTDASILLCGESGVGKSHIVEWLHECSQRAGGPLVSVNVGALSTSLFESELFGHKKGAFTDAKADRVGRFASACTGTLFLDEVATLSLPLQAKLLRVLESGEYEVLGSSETQRSDARLICATNADLAQLVARGEFRTDLLYRINTFVFELPPLRQRKEDIVPFATHLLAKHAQRYQMATKPLNEEVCAAFLHYPWPGNIRELSHVMERALLMSDGTHINLHDCQLRFASTPAPSYAQATVSYSEGQTLAELEKAAITHVLTEEKGAVSKAANRLGVSKSSLYRRIEKHGLKNEG
ncbi:sigma-54 dependent transcriptional regulator [Pseudoalteromonas sp. SMS1]|uniref:sigma-54-dependent transcriptional regulator n=1 Tax=Pseudoalteromonas sp. SMS1 TaxID=2908894 RepID=UPI001F42F0A3|nr:sigma-54 dependent transcriptional regulator [Pseudoalteromonas sp. SMS1]MCF2859729.1 sigma-54 dependent transcriptional regulator [Pseudoalteromonas sp. SMS1]